MNDNKEYKTCDHCCYDILDDEGDVMDHECNQYPFEEGDDYWTVEGITLIWSCWDDVSEELHDENPKKEYFTEEEALTYARVNGIIFTNRHSHEQQ